MYCQYKKVAEIIHSIEGNIVVAVSAMGKTTNNSERVVNLWFNNDMIFWSVFNEIKTIIKTLLMNFWQRVRTVFEDFKELEEMLTESPSLDYNFEYDKIVSYGEILSTKIVSQYLQNNSMSDGSISENYLKPILYSARQLSIGI